MKSIEQQKAELLDELMKNLQVCFASWNNEHTYDMVIDAKREYDAITAQKPFSKDPYIDEVLPARLVNFFDERIPLRENLQVFPRLSQCAELYPISSLKGIRGIGTKTIHEYSEILEKYGMLDKL